MAYFAVIRESGEDFEVQKCHINLWCLSGLFRRIFYLDIGLLLEAKGPGVLTKFSLALPCGMEFYDGKGTGKKSQDDANAESGEYWWDLKNKVLVLKNAELIFGSKVSINHEILKVEDEFEAPVFGINIENTRVVVDRSGKDFCFWNIIPDHHIEIGTKAYLRIRFETSNLGETWVWKPSNNGAILDFRIADIRETVENTKWNDLNNRIVELGELYFFVIAPAWLQFTTVSPSLRYMRLLEAHGWKDYLGRNTEKGKTIIYYWRSEKIVNTNKPFRAFLELSRETNPKRYLDSIITAVLVIIGIVALNNRSIIEDKLSALWSKVWTTIITLGIMGVFAKGKAIAAFVDQGVKHRARLRKFRRTKERNRYRP